MSPMRGLRDPVGPESPSTYWLRRAVLVGLVVLVVLLAWWLVASLTRSGSSTAPGPSATPAAVSSWSPQGWATPPATASASASSAKPSTPSATPAASSESTPASASPTTTAAAQACSGSVLDVAIRADAARAPVNEIVPLHLRVRNTASAPCRLSGEAIAVTVTSGSDRIWSTEDCRAWQPRVDVTLAAGQYLNTDVTWPGKRSVGSCTPSKEELRPGTYVATATVASSASGRFVLQLVG